MSVLFLHRVSEPSHSINYELIDQIRRDCRRTGRLSVCMRSNSPMTCCPTTKLNLVSADFPCVYTWFSCKSAAAICMNTSCLFYHPFSMEYKIIQKQWKHSLFTENLQFESCKQHIKYFREFCKKLLRTSSCLQHNNWIWKDEILQISCYINFWGMLIAVS